MVREFGQFTRSLQQMELLAESERHAGYPVQTAIDGEYLTVIYYTGGANGGYFKYTYKDQPLGRTEALKLLGTEV